MAHVAPDNRRPTTGAPVAAPTDIDLRRKLTTTVVLVSLRRRWR